MGRNVRTLTGHPDRTHSFGPRVTAYPYHFDHPDRLAETLQGAETLYNTYWIRYPYGGMTYEKAVENSRTLFQTAQKAGVRRIVHVSIANPSPTSPLAYYSGKAQVEEALIGTGLSYAIFRSTVIFGKEDILIHNIAWMVRHFPVFAVPGDGRYELRPIYVEDLADAMVQAGQTGQNTVQDAVGPESYTFNDLILLIAKSLRKNTRLTHFPPELVYALTAVMGRFVGDVILTREEIDGLLHNLLASQAPALGHTCLSAWIQENAAQLGVSYASEIKRHF